MSSPFAAFSAAIPAVSTADPARTRRWVLALGSFASFMFALDAMVLTTALSSVRATLHAPIEALGWIVNAYNLSFAVLLMSGAALGDRFGHRRVLALGLALFALASAACAMAPDATWLIAARAVQGAGAALAMPVGMTMIGRAYPGALRARALGIFGGVTGLALIVGPAAGGAISQGLAWPWIFWINVPLGALAMWLIVRKLPRGERADAPLDLPGALFAALASLGVVWALVRGHTAGWGSAEVVAASTAGAAMLAAFVVRQRAARAPMLPLHLFASRAFSGGIAASFLFYAPMYGMVFFLPQFLQSQGRGAWDAGIRLIPWTATLVIVAPLSGRCVARLGERTLVVLGVAMQAFGIAWIAAIVRPDLAYAQLIAPLLVAGAGVSMAMPAAQQAVLGAVPPEQIGKASGVFNVFRYLGGVFGVALLVEVFAWNGGARDFGSGSSSRFSAQFASAMTAGALLSALGAVAALALPGRGARGTSHAPGPRSSEKSS